VYKKHNKVLPDDPWEQLRMGIDAVFRSWNIPRAVKYREINKITGLRGTAVNVQTMVYGNINDNSGTGALWPLTWWLLRCFLVVTLAALAAVVLLVHRQTVFHLQAGSSRCSLDPTPAAFRTSCVKRTPGC
jgi:hypothetical protein